ncbi:hypothetical protein [Pseudophaeobacter sp.]
MMEYSANTKVKLAMERAHAERGQVFLNGLTWVLRLPGRLRFSTRVSRWA